MRMEMPNVRRPWLGAACNDCNKVWLGSEHSEQAQQDGEVRAEHGQHLCARRRSRNGRNRHATGTGRRYRHRCLKPPLLIPRLQPCFTCSAAHPQGVLPEFPSEEGAGVGAGSWPWPAEPTAARSESDPLPLLTCGCQGDGAGEERGAQAGEHAVGRDRLEKGSAHQGLLAGVPPSVKGAKAASGAEPQAPDPKGWSACRACGIGGAQAARASVLGCSFKPAGSDRSYKGNSTPESYCPRAPMQPWQSPPNHHSLHELAGNECPPAAGGGPQAPAAQPQGPAQRALHCQREWWPRPAGSRQTASRGQACVRGQWMCTHITG